MVADESIESKERQIECTVRAGDQSSPRMLRQMWPLEVFDDMNVTELGACQKKAHLDIYKRSHPKESTMMLQCTGSN
eukprot:scaffold247_cov172-Ochromonas_danica.AAC.19